MTKTKLCKKCGIELSKENAWSKSAIRFKPHSYCKTCEAAYNREYYKKNQAKIKKRSSEQYRRDLNNGFWATMKVGNKKHRIIFKTLSEKELFVTVRRLQIRWGICHTDLSSSENKKVDELVEERREDGKVRRYYIDTKCDECGGLIRYQHGFKICECCGLVHGDHNIEELNNTHLNAVDQGIVDRLDKLPMCSYDGNYDNLENDDAFSTFDMYYSRAYSKVLK